MRYNCVLVMVLIVVAVRASGQTTLDRYIAVAKESSPLIIDNRNQQGANMLESERLRAQYTKPLVSVTGNYLMAPVIDHSGKTSKFELNPASSETYSGYDLAASNGGIYQGLVTITQPLFNRTRYEAFAEQSVVAARINENNAVIGEHDVEKLVIDQYLLCIQDKQQWQYTDSLLNLLAQQQQVGEKLVQSGLLKQSDLGLVNIEIQTQRNARINYRTTYKRDLLDLNALCGINDTTLIILPNVVLEKRDSLSLSKWLAKYRLDSLNLNAQRNVFDLKYKPLVNAYANGGLNAVYAPTIPNRFGMSAGISFTWNIFDGHQRSINKSKIETLTRSVNVYRDYFQRQNTVRIDRINTELSGIEQRISTTRQQLKDYDTLMTFYKREFMQGQLSVISYINTLKNLMAVNRDYLLLQTNQQLLINLYNYWNW